MASQSFTVTAEGVSSLITTINCTNVVLTILIYDWMFCLDQEIVLIWSRKTRRTIAVLVYVLARYMLIVENALVVVTMFPISFLSCEANVWVQVVSEALSLFSPAIFSAMRTYALSGANTYLAIVAFILSIVPMITNLIENFKFQSIQVLPSPFNCSSIGEVPPQLQYDFTMITRACVISADLLIIVITWMYTYKSYKIQKSLRLGSSFGSILLYDGSLYFVVLASLNVLDMVLMVLKIDEAVFNSSNYVVTFLEPISSILICHFLLNLRQVNHKLTDPSLFSNPRLDDNISIQFATRHSTALPAFIGSFGEPVHTGSTIDPDLEFEENLPDLIQNASSEANRGIVEISRV